MEAKIEIEKLKEENALLKKRLAILRLMDDIRDKYEDIRDVLKYCLRAIASELSSKSAFVQYINIFNEKKIISVDTHGIIHKELFQIIDDFYNKIKQTTSELVVDSSLLKEEQNFLILPMIPDNNFLGIIGTEKIVAITETDKILLKDAASILDTAIINDCKKQLEKDKNKIIEEVDNILDEYTTDFKTGLEKVANHIVAKFNNIAVYFFGAGDDDFTIIAGTQTGKIIWDNYEMIKYGIMEAIQICHEKGELYESRYEGDCEEYNVVGKFVRSVVAYPLKTAGDETAGTMVLLDNNYFSDGHQSLVKAAASQIDDAILKEKRIEYMVKRFNRFVGMNIMDVLLQNPEWLNPRKEHLVVLSVDLSGSTQYANTEPDAFKVFENINEYLGLIGKIIKNDFHATLDKYIGDEVMGLFGAPVTDSNCAHNGVKCAIYILDKVNEFNSRRSKDKKPIFGVKITLGLVNAIIGEVGSEDTQTDYTVIGNGVNEVFRIAKYAEPNKIFINESLNEKIKDQYKTRLFDKVQIKGFTEPVPVYEIEIK